MAAETLTLQEAAGDEPFRYPASGFVTGSIGRRAVSCLSAGEQARLHDGDRCGTSIGATWGSSPGLSPKVVAVAAETLTLQEAADELGVHYMTVYRYVRLGVLPAEKVGGSWRIDAADLGQMRHSAPSPSAGGRGRFGPAPWAARFEARLRAGDEVGAWGVLEAALTSGATPVEAYLEVIGPSMRSIGDAWEAGELDVGVEHRASVIVTRLLGRMGPKFTRRGRPRGTVVLGAPAGDLHGIPVTMLADIVRSTGFTAVDLGADVPEASFVLAVRSCDPAAVLVTVTTPSNEAAVRSLVSALRAAVPEVRVLVGGRAVDSEAAAVSLGAEAWVPDALGAVELLTA